MNDKAGYMTNLTQLVTLVNYSCLRTHKGTTQTSVQPAINHRKLIQAAILHEV
ncbi:hypothetical protein PRUB_b1142 [Pseudoalteromonas rubra]|uniref:Uncharacterized protein n=1 Tax=Pseudoalteromonas rubra TaxID=43658 RepID=A0A8T0C1K0_9GAMM|nr:hypothetical protein PRUB_b1142 [Pseudoalteromonas rubra]